MTVNYSPFGKKKDELLAKAKELGIKNAESLNYKDLQKAIIAKINDVPNMQVPKEVPKKEESPTLIFKDENGIEWTFSEKAPKKFRCNGVLKSQEAWIKNEEVMEQLILGNSVYVEQLKN